MNVRLVAYRKAQDLGPTVPFKEQPFELDLQESPNISINYQFADITEPNKRKASFTQTFKLPFTEKNNTFFQNWFDVNLETLVYTSSKKFPAVIYVGTLMQFEGVIQLKSVRLKARLYEVVVLGTTADLFTNIGSKKLKDIFLNDDEETYTRDLNHLYNAQNIENSWQGDGSTSFLNISGQSLRDTAGQVNKVMYPLSITKPNFIFNPQGTQYLTLNQTTIDFDIANFDQGLAQISELTVDIEQFRPAVQLRELLTRLLNRAGFTYTSQFIDGSYFRKLYMTTCNDRPIPGPYPYSSAAGLGGLFVAGNSSNVVRTYAPGETIACNGYTAGVNLGSFNVDTTTPTTGFSVPMDPMGIAQSYGDNTLYRRVNAELPPLTFKSWIRFNNLEPCGGQPPQGGPISNMVFAIRVVRYYDNGNGNFELGYTLYEQEMPLITDTSEEMENTIFSGGVVNIPIQFNLDWEDCAVGDAIRVLCRLRGVKVNDTSQTTQITFGKQCLPSASVCDDTAPQNYMFAGLFNEVSIGFGGYIDTAIYGKEVDIPNCIDASITQKDFLQDLVQRFNLVIAPDTNTPTNLIIEPYSTYLAGGDLKYWTDKVDLGKEIIVKDTTSLQKKTIKLGDQEDVDLNNKRIKETTPVHSPYGKIEITNTENEFASGELKNKSIFAPFINDKVWSDTVDTGAPTYLTNMTVQYEISYDRNSEGQVEQKLEATKPKLFYYSGSPHSMEPSGYSYNLHHTFITIPEGNTEIEAYNFTTHPVCSPFEVDPTQTIGTSTRSLYWNANPPIAPNLTCFSYNEATTNIGRSLYYEYYSQYLNAIYDKNSRIVELYLNLNQNDIHNFKFSDNIFIKDSYYRVLSIKNYIIGGKKSTKVTLLLIGELYNVTCPGCNQIPQSAISTNANTSQQLFIWCPEDDPGCTFDSTNPNTFLTNQACCDCNNGTFVNLAFNGLGFCWANAGSLSVQQTSLLNLTPIFNASFNAKNLSSFVLAGKNGGLTIGNNTNKFGTNIIRNSPNDFVIKYRNENRLAPPIQGESHKIILLGNTVGTTRGFATTNGETTGRSIKVPTEGVCRISVNGTAIVIGGTDATFGLGYVESFQYFTGFSNRLGITTQIGLPGGVQNSHIRQDTTVPAKCTLYIDTIQDTGVIRFGLQDAIADAQRLWTLTVDIDIQRVPNIERPFNETFALFQNGEVIEYENGDYLIWN